MFSWVPRASSMNHYPPELKTPPLPSVVLLGKSELHAQLKSFLNGLLMPPVHVLANSDISSVAQYFGPKKPRSGHQFQPKGVLKAGWLERHRTDRPAAAVIFLDRSDIALSDPNKWTEVIQQLKHVKECCDQRNVRFVVVPVTTGPEKELPSDRLSALMKANAVDSRLILPFGLSANESQPIILEEDLKEFSKLLLELSWAHYQSFTLHVVQKHNLRTLKTQEINTWVTFKLAVLAEFQQDWPSAIKNYRSAYDYLLDVSIGNPVNMQKFHEMTTVAEILHLKLVTILFHQKRTEEGLQQFVLHMTKFKPAPGAMKPGSRAAHWEWISRQYETLADILSERAKEGSDLHGIQSRWHPAYLLQCAAEASIERRLVLAGANVQATSDELKVVPGPYCGQVMAETATGGLRGLTGEEFERHVLSGGSIQFSSGNALDLLTRSFGQYRGSTALDQHLCLDGKIYHIAMLMAREHMAADDASNARSLLLQVSSAYRRHFWDQLLSHCLGQLRECARKLNIISEHITYSLELSTMEKVLDGSQRATMAQAALKTLLSVAEGDPTEQGQEGHGVKEKYEYHFPMGYISVEQREPPKGKSQLEKCSRQDAGWSRILTQFAGFSTPGELPRKVVFGLAIRNNTTEVIPISRCVAEFVDGDGQRRKEEMSCHICSSTASDDTGSSSSNLDLQSKRWKILTVELEPRCPGDMKAEYIMLHVGDHAVLHCHLDGLDNPIAMDESPLRKTSCVAGLHSIHIKHVGALPTITVCAPRYSLVGEKVPITVEVSTDCPLEDLKLHLSTDAAESICYPLLCDVNSNEGEATHSENALAVRTLGIGEVWTSRKLLVTKGPGQVTVKACLTLTKHCEMEQSLDVVFEEPFCLTPCFTTAVDSYALMSPQDSLTTDPSGTLSNSSPFPISQPVNVPGNQLIFLNAYLESVARCQLEISYVELCGPEAVDVQVTAVLPAMEPAIVHKGDVHSFLYVFKTIQYADNLSIGTMSVKWRRCDKMELHQASTSTLDSGHCSPTARGASSTMDEMIQTHIPIPCINARESLMSIVPLIPASITAGTPFPYLLSLSNNTIYPEELQIWVHDAEGCLFAGDRNSKIVVLPKQNQELNLEVVAYTAGVVKLPKVKVTSTRTRCWVEVEGTEMYVMPVKV